MAPLLEHSAAESSPADSQDSALPGAATDTNDEEIIYDRPNRFHGPPSTWRTWTRSEREVVKSIDQERSQNLAANLLVAHRIKQHANSLAPALTRQQKKRKGKARAKSTGSESNADSTQQNAAGRPFEPPKVWTAWPMPPEQVPRKSHTTGILDTESPWTIGVEPDPRPSGELEAWIIATITKFARQRWQARESAEPDVVSPEPARASEHAEPSPSASPSPDATPSLASHSIHTFSPSASPPPIFYSSQPLFAASRNVSATTHAKSQPQTPTLPSPTAQPPVLLADDDHATQLLQPATRHIIAQIDSILQGLHIARQAYATVRPRASTRSRSRARGRSQPSTQRVVSETHSEAEPDPSSDNQRRRNPIRSSSRPRQPAPKRKRSPDRAQPRPIAKLARLGLRDWSDVLGMAAIRGWDADVLARAGERCAGLFGEGMGFCEVGDPEDGGEVREWGVGGEGGGGGESGAEEEGDDDGVEEEDEGEDEADEDEDDEDEDGDDSDTDDGDHGDNDDDEDDEDNEDESNDSDSHCP